MKTKFLFILLLLISIGFTSCEEEDANTWPMLYPYNTIRDVACTFYVDINIDATGDFDLQRYYRYKGTY